MKTLSEQMAAYGAYHRDTRNKLTHFVGVPLVTFSILLFMSWFRFAPAPEVPLTLGVLFYVSVAIYYLILDWRIALLQLPVTALMLVIADRVALWPLRETLIVFVATFVGGWIVQLIGHGIEGRRPALLDNFLQLFNAPLFLTCEVLFLMGYRRDLQAAAPHDAVAPATHLAPADAFAVSK